MKSKSNFLRVMLFLVTIICVFNNVHAQIVQNGSFESPILSSGTFQYNPSSASWTFSSGAGGGGAGISTSASAFTSGSPEVPLGNQVVFLQNTGCISTSSSLAANSILTLTATQRVNYNTQLQSIAVYVNNVQQPITVGSKNGAYTVYSITPPRDYYTAYGVNLSSVTTSGTYTIKICGTASTGDATAFIDTVAISTPQNRAFGFWSDYGANGAWRSDYQDINTQAQYSSTCAFPIGCGQPFSYLNSNWFSSLSSVAGTQFLYTPTASYWQVIVNDENNYDPGCESGPPDQSIPLQPRGAANGARFDILDNTSLAYPSLGANMIYQLAYLPGYLTSPCIPYLSFSASARHGNGKPIAVMDKAGYYRPRLVFKESVFQTTGVAYAYVAITLSGFDDNIPRAMFLVLGEQQMPSLDIANKYWNWNIKNSKYYPGWMIAYIDVSIAQSRCGFSTSDMPVLSFTKQWIPSGQSSSAISSYNFDLYKLVSCIANETVTQGTMSVPGWSGVKSQLPDPIIIESLEWAIETTTYDVNTGIFTLDNSPWVGFWGMHIQ